MGKSSLIGPLTYLIYLIIVHILINLSSECLEFYDFYEKISFEHFTEFHFSYGLETKCLLT